ncbi:hypothetical protein CC1G_15254 [Coprinopsis cinerea okayama7|uniref:Uncharacterized protein n=1 Tax=Coprinopsis cinerea (strain Okayama-7 / 130 / ATCC MYA-4618 / FGSC 9003) TaxID=240176 RepID=D6RPV3_COPC7|nr:hypothetical protein CC1G_15254 [Coprinopsis cinerea okayama7\|eukprot:XP_002910346.1 hypothetical protein CC1G_15254 [Coprinopsis cinerea okayama7\
MTVWLRPFFRFWYKQPHGSKCAVLDTRQRTTCSKRLTYAIRILILVEKTCSARPPICSLVKIGALDGYAPLKVVEDQIGGDGGGINGGLSKEDRKVWLERLERLLQGFGSTLDKGSFATEDHWRIFNTRFGQSSRKKGEVEERFFGGTAKLQGSTTETPNTDFAKRGIFQRGKEEHDRSPPPQTMRTNEKQGLQTWVDGCLVVDHFRSWTALLRSGEEEEKRSEGLQSAWKASWSRIVLMRESVNLFKLSLGLRRGETAIRSMNTLYSFQKDGSTEKLRANVHSLAMDIDEITQSVADEKMKRRIKHVIPELDDGRSGVCSTQLRSWKVEGGLPLYVVKEEEWKKNQARRPSTWKFMFKRRGERGHVHVTFISLSARAGRGRRTEIDWTLDIHTRPHYLRLTCLCGRTTITFPPVPSGAANQLG